MHRALPEVKVYKIVRTVRAYFFINSFIYLYDFMTSFILYSSRTSSRLLLTETAVYYSTGKPFYLIRATERVNYATVLHSRMCKKYGRKAEQKTWSQ